MSEPAFNRIGRLFFGSLLIVSALTKLVDLTGFVSVVSTYGLLPDWGPLPMALASVAGEATLGLWLWSGRRAPVSSLLLVVLLVLYCSWLSFAYLDGRRLDNAGTFGTVIPLRVSLGLVLCQLGLLAAAFFLWSSVTAHQLRQQLAVAAIDLRCHGISTKPPTGTS